jgi:hypothetical protein
LLLRSLLLTSRLTLERLAIGHLETRPAAVRDPLAASVARHYIIYTLIFGLFSSILIAQADEKTQTKMFCKALRHFSSAPYYLVVGVENELTGIRKNVCTEAPFLQGAVDKQNGKYSGKNLSCRNFKNRTISLSNPSALSNIGFDLYSIAELDSFAQTIDLLQIIDRVRTEKYVELHMVPKKRQIMFAHLMFQNGIMTSRGCISGDMISLTPFEDR